LDANGGTQGINDAWKFNKKAVARCLDDTSAVFGDLGVDQLLAVRGLTRQHSFLVGSYKPAVPNHIGSHDRGEAAPHA
jgi:hypothetical protein